MIDTDDMIQGVYEAIKGETAVNAMALAAIKAMRSPTEGMVSFARGFVAAHEATGTAVDPKALWMGMVDRALEEQ